MLEFSPFPHLEPERRTRPRLEPPEPVDLDVFPRVEHAERDGEGTEGPIHAAPSMAAVWAKPRHEPTGGPLVRVPLGLRGADDYLAGGVPAGSTLLVSGPPFGGKRSLACNFLASAVASGAPALALITDGDITQWRQGVGNLTARVPDDRKGLACFLDVFGALESGPAGPRIAAPLTEQMLGAVANACEALPSTRRRFVFDSFSTVAALSGFPAAFSMLMRMAALLRREGATSLFLVEAGAHTPMELHLIKRQADGAIDFRQYGGIPELQLSGLGMPGPSPWLQGRAETGAVQVPARGV